jgi:hypothetical protein
MSLMSKHSSPHARFKGKISSDQMTSLFRMSMRDHPNSSTIIRAYYVDGRGYADIARSLKTNRMMVYNSVARFYSKCALILK